MADKYVTKNLNPVIEAEETIRFEKKYASNERAVFHENLIRNNMTWKEFPQFGLITHNPSGLSMHMAINTTPRHKTYTLEKLKERVRNTGTWIITP